MMITARVVGARTDGDHLLAVLVACGWCGRRHWHAAGAYDAVATPTCGTPGAAYQITFPAQATG